METPMNERQPPSCPPNGDSMRTGKSLCRGGDCLALLLIVGWSVGIFCGVFNSSRNAGQSIPIAILRAIGVLVLCSGGMAAFCIVVAGVLRVSVYRRASVVGLSWATFFFTALLVGLLGIAFALWDFVVGPFLRLFTG
jgi:hypothetical protein